jgi:hypothetical protein
MEGEVSDQEITGVNVTGVPIVSPEGELLNDPVEELLLEMQRELVAPDEGEAREPHGQLP